jgi:hypothetical protein
MDKILMTHISRIKSCMSRGKFDSRKIKDRFAMEVSVTAVDRALENGVLTEKHFKDMILGKKVGKK